MIDIRFWRMMAPSPTGSLLVCSSSSPSTYGRHRHGRPRWIDLGPIQIQPSEMMKIALVMALAAYYPRLDPARVRALLGDPPAPPDPDAGRAGHRAARPRHRDPAPRRRRRGDVPRRRQPLVLRRRRRQRRAHHRRPRVAGHPVAAARGLPVPPDLHLPRPRRRPARRRLPHHPGDDRHGLGRPVGRGYMQGTQSRLNFLPEKHTDFIFTALAEEFGYVGTTTILVSTR